MEITMTLEQLRNAVADMSDFPGDLELVFNDEGRLQNGDIFFEVTGRDSKNKWCNVGTPVLLVRAGS